MSHYLVPNFWNRLNLVDSKAGIIGHCPSGGLYTFVDGVYWYDLKIIHNLLVPYKKNMTDKRKDQHPFQRDLSFYEQKKWETKWSSGFPNMGDVEAPPFFW